MSKKRRRSNFDLAELIVRALAAIFLSAYIPVAAWWNSLPESGRIFMLVGISIAVFAGIGAVIMFSIYRKRERADAWKRAMHIWQNKEQAGMVVQNQSAKYMTDVELEKFATQIFSKMGYKAKRTGETGDHGVDVTLLNPKGQIEIVQCKQWNKLVGEPQIRDLYGAMQHERAVKGWLIAPRGFSEPAKKWSKGKEIELVDDNEISYLIGIAFEK